MGCQSQVRLGNNLTFTITTHDPDTGVLTDADAPPDYRVYEDETAVAILTGSMATLDAANTDGFYSELIPCTIGNGFEVGKSYNIYIEATVDGDTGGISYGVECVAADITLAEINAEIVDVLTVDTYSKPGQETPPDLQTIKNMIAYSYKFMTNRVTSTAAGIEVYNDDAVTVDQKATHSDAAGTYDRGEFISGP